MDEDLQLAIFCLTCLTVLITGSTLFGVSFDIIEPNFRGLTFDDATQHILVEEGLKKNGRHFVGLGKRFIRFPTALQEITHDRLRVRSRDGLVIEMDYSFQYHLNARFNDVYRLYLDWGEKDWATFYGKLADRDVRDVASRYLAAEYFSNRELINEEMTDLLSSSMERVYARVDAFQLLNMEFASGFADKIEETEVTKQGIEQALYEQQKVQVQADSLVQVAETLAEVTVVSANATALSYLATVTADSEALAYRVQTQSAALKALRESLQLNSSESLLSFLNVIALEETRTTQVKMGQMLPDFVTN